MFDLQKNVQKDREWIDGVWEKLDKKLSVISVRSKEKLPYSTENGVHTDMKEKNICYWTNGFWPGLMWLMYYGTKNDTYKATAERAEEFLDEAFIERDELHHDVGFMWHLSSCVNYRITGNDKSRKRALYAADILASRYNINGKFLRAWNNWHLRHNKDDRGWAIIDSMMNIPILYWASKELDDPRYAYIATNHADTTMKYHIRPDGSVKHIVEYDHITGEYVQNHKGQGFDEDSSWSRGQAWALYGYVLSYIHTGKLEYLDTAKRIAHYFISCICDDYLPKVDFRSPSEPVYYDSTAGAIAACGLIEIARNVPCLEGKIYLNAAINILKALDEKCCNYDLDEDSILQNGSQRYPYHPDDTEGLHVPLIYGDYYFAEAIYKLKGFDLLFE